MDPDPRIRTAELGVPGRSVVDPLQFDPEDPRIDQWIRLRILLQYFGP